MWAVLMRGKWHLRPGGKSTYPTSRLEPSRTLFVLANSSSSSGGQRRVIRDPSSQAKGDTPPSRSSRRLRIRPSNANTTRSAEGDLGGARHSQLAAYPAGTQAAPHQNNTRLQVQGMPSKRD